MNGTHSASIAVVGAGITGAAAAWEAAGAGADVTLFESAPSAGGKTQSSPFAGLDSIDCGADAFLARVPDAVDLAGEVGLGSQLVHPTPVGAAVWYDRLHDIPEGLVLGVPGNAFSLARSRLLSLRGRARAAFEPLLPRTSVDDDSIGNFIRARFGNEVHERLVDALVGSIYATDTDDASLGEIPQLAALARHRSVLLAARTIARSNAGTASAAASPIFATPRGGVAELAAATVATARKAGCAVRFDAPAHLDRDGARWRVNGEIFDAVVVATPAAALARILPADSGQSLAAAETADVAMLALHVSEEEFPERLSGRSGYLVPKPVQHDVTAVSFGSQKWTHWAPPAGGQILRVSLGRDRAPVLHLDDDELVERALTDLRRHLGANFSPIDIRVTRWPGAFAQYRPHHRRWVDRVRADLPPGIFVAGAAFDGNGIPACVRSGRTNAEHAVTFARSLGESTVS